MKSQERENIYGFIKEEKLSRLLEKVEDGRVVTSYLIKVLEEALHESEYLGNKLKNLEREFKEACEDVEERIERIKWVSVDEKVDLFKTIPSYFYSLLDVLTKALHFYEQTKLNPYIPLVKKENVRKAIREMYEEARKSLKEAEKELSFLITLPGFDEEARELLNEIKNTISRNHGLLEEHLSSLTS